MQEHNFAQVLRWIADGQEVQHRLPGTPASEWDDFKLGDEACRKLIKGTLRDDWEFRLKPRTVKIGSREVEAPVLEPVEGQELFRCSHGGVVDRSCYGSFHPTSIWSKAVRDGMTFASPEAAESAYSAYSALLRGEA